MYGVGDTPNFTVPTLEALVYVGNNSFAFLHLKDVSATNDDTVTAACALFVIDLNKVFWYGNPFNHNAYSLKGVVIDPVLVE